MKVLLAALYKQPIPLAAGSVTLQMVNLSLANENQESHLTLWLFFFSVVSVLCFFLRESTYWPAQRCPILLDTQRDKRG